MYHLLLVILVLLQLVPVTPVEAQELIRHHEARYVMGTFLEITFFLPKDRDGVKLLDDSFRIATDLELVLSNYNSESEISLVNAAKGNSTIKLSRELAEFLAVSRDLSQKTGGAFDISVRPMLSLWQEASKTGRAPTTAELASLKRLVGNRSYDLNGNQLVKSANKVQFDTGGIGKGFTVDKIISKLLNAQVRHALVHFGRSSTAAIGAPPGEDGWRMLVKFNDDSPAEVLLLKDVALSASDTMGRPLLVGAKQYGHIIDPADGMPAPAGVKGYVLARSATSAEAATKLLVLRGLPGAEVADSLTLLEASREQGGNHQRVNYELKKLSNSSRS